MNFMIGLLASPASGVFRSIRVLVQQGADARHFNDSVTLPGTDTGRAIRLMMPLNSVL
jgi:hypothetical protein